MTPITIIIGIIIALATLAICFCVVAGRNRIKFDYEDEYEMQEQTKYLKNYYKKHPKLAKRHNIKIN